MRFDSSLLPPHTSYAPGTEFCSGLGRSPSHPRPNSIQFLLSGWRAKTKGNKTIQLKEQIPCLEDQQGAECGVQEARLELENTSVQASHEPRCLLAQDFIVYEQTLWLNHMACGSCKLRCLLNHTKKRKHGWTDDKHWPFGDMQSTWASRAGTAKVDLPQYDSVDFILICNLSLEFL